MMNVPCFYAIIHFISIIFHKNKKLYKKRNRFRSKVFRLLLTFKEKMNGK